LGRERSGGPLWERRAALGIDALPFARKNITISPSVPRWGLAISVAGAHPLPTSPYRRRTMPYLLALLIGVVAGMRALTPPAAVAWFTHLGWLKLAGTWLEFLSNVWVRSVLTLLMVVELVTDQLPTTPSRTVPVQFGARLVTGAFSGAAIAAGATAGGSMIGGALAGAVGAVIGTLGGRAVRGKLAATFKNDHPAAFIEDAVAIGAAVLIGVALR
jgi:uncharacterized membrane protein